MEVKLNLRFAFELSTADGSPLNPDLVVNAQNNGSKYFQGHIKFKHKGEVSSTDDEVPITKEKVADDNGFFSLKIWVNNEADDAEYNVIPIDIDRDVYIKNSKKGKANVIHLTIQDTPATKDPLGNTSARKIIIIDNMYPIQ